MHPISKKMEAKFRGVTSSEDFNQWIEDNYYDLVQLFNISSENNEKLSQSLSLFLNEVHFLNAKIHELESSMELILSMISDLYVDPSNIRKVLSKVFTSKDNVLDPINGLKSEVDTEFGTLRMPLQQTPVSKVYILNSVGEKFLPNTLKIDLYESSSPIDILQARLPQNKLIQDKNILRAFDGNSLSYWIRSVPTDTSVDRIYAVIEVELPQNIINHLRINNINVVPAPIFSINIEDIRYLDGDVWNSIPEFPSASFLKNVGALTFLFNERETTKLRISISSDNWRLVNGERIFSYGFKNIDIFFSRFVEGTSSAIVEFEIPNSEINSFNTIEEVRPILLEGGLRNTDAVETKVYLDKHGVEEYTLGTTLPALTKKIYVEIILNSSSNTSPALSQLDIVYTTS